MYFTLKYRFVYLKIMSVKNTKNHDWFMGEKVLMNEINEMNKLVTLIKMSTLKFC